MNLLKIIATFILIYLVFRLFITLVMPMLLRWWINSYKKKFYKQNPHLWQEEQNRKRKQDSRININYKNRKYDDKSLSDIGEYVDFEDVNNDNKKQNKK